MDYSTESGSDGLITHRITDTNWEPFGKRTPMDQNYHMSFDPGEKTGWASFDHSGTLTGNGVIGGGLRGVSDFLCGLRAYPVVMICETYRIKNFQFGHDMSTIPTIRIIGVLEECAHRFRSRWVEQESNVYRTGMVWAGLEVPKGHVKDNESAIGHGVYWLHKNGLWKIALD